MKFTLVKGLKKPLLFAAVTICLVVAAAVAFFVFETSSSQLPEGLYGVWYSDDPRYQDCFLKISTDALVVRGADGEIYNYSLKSVRQKTTGDSPGLFYTLAVADQDEAELEFRLYFNAEASILSYANQRDVIWTKEERQEQH